MRPPNHVLERLRLGAVILPPCAIPDVVALRAAPKERFSDGARRTVAVRALQAGQARERLTEKAVDIAARAVGGTVHGLGGIRRRARIGGGCVSRRGLGRRLGASAAAAPKAHREELDSLET